MVKKRINQFCFHQNSNSSDEHSAANNEKRTNESARQQGRIEKRSIII